MLKTEKTFRFWIGLSILSLASTALITMLWLIFVYYPTNYQTMHWDYPTHFPTYFRQYYIWQILGATALIITGSYLIKSATKNKTQT